MGTLLYFEIRHILRDVYQLLLVAVLIPLILTPFVSHSYQQVSLQTKNAFKGTYFIAISGDAAHQVRDLVPKLGRFRELPLHGSPEESLKQGVVDCYLVAQQSPQARLSKGQLLETEVMQSKAAGVPEITIHFSSGRDRSLRARLALAAAFQDHLKTLRQDYLRAHGKDPKMLWAVKDNNLASPGQEKARQMGGIVPLLLVFVLFGSGSITALDAVAGERERGSLATVLVSALSRPQIAIAKWLSVALVSLSFGSLQLTGMVGYWVYKGGAEDLSVSPLQTLIVLLIALLLCLQVSAILLWISARSTSFKQAQLLYMPALLVGAALAAVSWMPELSLASVVCVVPISGLSLAVRDLFHEQLNWLWFGLTVLASLATTALFLRWVVDSLQLDREAPVDDRASEQMRQQLGQDILWYFAAAGALMVVLPGNFPGLSGLRGQVGLNQGVMLLLSLTLLKFYRQPIASSLSWRNTHWKNWLICLVAAPLVHVCANSVAIVSSWILPMSEEMVRQMTELLIPEKTSTLELLLLIAASPALCEELAFRGTILHAIRKPADLRRPTWATCLAVGLAFGAFHFSLQRLLPTATIGVVLTYVALRSGSIWPCMWLHLVNNSLALLLHSQHLDYSQFPAWTWLAAWALLFVLLRGLTQGFPCHNEEHAGVE